MPKMTLTDSLLPSAPAPLSSTITLYVTLFLLSEVDTGLTDFTLPSIMVPLCDITTTDSPGVIFAMSVWFTDTVTVIAAGSLYMNTVLSAFNELPARTEVLRTFPSEDA